jgi:hypothetical protein
MSRPLLALRPAAALPFAALAFAALPFVALPFVAPAAHASVLGAGDIMASFNAVTLGNMSFTDSQGRVVAGGSLSAGEVDTSNVPLGTAFAGFGDGNAYGPGSVNNGNGQHFYWGGAGNTPSGGTATSGYSFPITSSALFAPLQTLSTNLAGLAGQQVSSLPMNNGVLQPTAFTTIGGAKVGVLDVTGSVLSNAAGFQFNANGADVLVINVDTSGSPNTSFSYSGNPNDNYGSKQKVIWNFYDDTGSISLAGWARSRQSTSAIRQRGARAVIEAGRSTLPCGRNKHRPRVGPTPAEDSVSPPRRQVHIFESGDRYTRCMPRPQPHCR